MDSQKVNDWLQLIGMLGIMASLVFVGLQVRQTQSIGEGESAANYANYIIAARQLFIDNADVWQRGCAGEELTATGYRRDETALVFGAAIEIRLAELAEIETHPDYDIKFCGM